MPLLVCTKSQDLFPSVRSIVRRQPVLRLSSQAPRKTDSAFPLPDPAPAPAKLREPPMLRAATVHARLLLSRSYVGQVRMRGFLRSPCKHIIKHLPCTTDVPLSLGRAGKGNFSLASRPQEAFASWFCTVYPHSTYSFLNIIAAYACACVPYEWLFLCRCKNFSEDSVNSRSGITGTIFCMKLYYI